MSRTTKPRMWIRVYRMALLVCALVLLITAAMLTLMSQREAYRRELSRALNEHAMVRRSMESTIAILVRHEGSVEQAARLSFSYASLPDASLALLDDAGTTLESTMPEGLAVPFYTGNQRASLLKEYEGARFLMVQSPLSVQGTQYKLLYARPVDSLFHDGRQWGLTMSVACVAALLSLMFFLRFAVRRALLPLGAVSAEAARIAGGEYSVRAPEADVDEIDRLSTSLNRMAQAVQTHIGQLMAQNQTQRQLISDLSHEMKTPMSSIIGYARLLRHANVPVVSQEKALEYIESEGSRLEALSLRLMELSRLDQSTRFGFQHVAVPVLVQDALRALHAKIERSGRAVETDIHAVDIDCDRELMLCLLTNLIDNALKYAPEGVPVQVGCTTGNGEVTIWVHDAGTGVSPNQTEALKQPFFMLDKARTRREQGAGLGLSLCDRIARVHGGELVICSDESGFTASVVLQLQHNSETMPENGSAMMSSEPTSVARKGRNRK